MKFFSLLLLFSINTTLSWASNIYELDQDKLSSQPHVESSKSSLESAVWGIGEEQIDKLFNNSSDLVSLLDPYTLYSINTPWMELLGWSKQELLSQPFEKFMHPEDIATTQIAAYQATQSSIVHGLEFFQNQKAKIPMLTNFENRYRTKQGEYCLLQWLILLQVSGSNTCPPMLGIAKNITLQKQVEERKIAIERAKEATQKKSTFVAHMSHEIRTPLNGILGFIELALEEEMSEKVNNYLQNAHESALLLLEIANDVIDVSRVEVNALKIEKADFNLGNSLESVISILNLQAEKKSITLKSSISSSLPLSLRGDQNRFKQILLNLGGNALKFTHQGRVSLKIDGKAHTEHPDLFMLRGTVQDTGIGMEPQFMKQLFQPFSQESRPLNRQFGGAGLGLYITKQLCEKMGGTISVLSTLGLGSTFQFQILFENSLSSILPLQKRTFSLSSIQLPVSQILVVDDNVMNQKLLKLILNRLGCKVDIVNDGRQALAAVNHKSYELLFMDGEMPHLDGLEATRQIRQQFSLQQLPIIGLTAHAMTNHQDQFLKSGMNGYLTKPINQKSLIDEILRCCEQKKE